MTNPKKRDEQSQKTGRKEAKTTSFQSQKVGHPYLPAYRREAQAPGQPADARPVSHQLRWDRANRDAKRAHHAVAKALRKGRLTREPCEVCGAVHGVDGAVLHAHHEDYSKPLDVVWLCRRHHRRLHAIIRWGHWVKCR